MANEQSDVSDDMLVEELLEGGNIFGMLGVVLEWAQHEGIRFEQLDVEQSRGYFLFEA